MKMVSSLLPLRIIQSLFALILIGLSSYVCQWYDNETLTPSPSQFRFLLILSVWSLLASAYLHFAPTKWARYYHAYLALIIEIVTSVFYLSGFIALALFVYNLKFCRGSVCLSARANITFAAFNSIAWGASTLILARTILRSGYRDIASAGVMDSEMARAGDV